MIKPHKLQAGDRVAAISMSWGVRELRSYAAMGILRQISGLILGRPGGNVPIAAFGAYDDAVLQVVADEEGLTALPIVTRMDVDHTDPMIVLPDGVTARIDGGRQPFAVVERAVTARAPE